MIQSRFWIDIVELPFILELIMNLFSLNCFEKN